MTRRQIILFVLAALAALPLLWLNIDPDAGQKLLQWTSASGQRLS
jgi:hypothetical protein